MSMDTVQEYLAIRHGMHPNWGGDCVLNAEVYLKRLASSPKASAALQEFLNSGDLLPPGAKAYALRILGQS